MIKSGTSFFVQKSACYDKNDNSRGNLKLEFNGGKGMNKPARKIRPKKNLNSYRGKMFSEKNGAMIYWESLLEKDFIKILEFDFKIISFESQPIEINYYFNNKERRYFPDFRATTSTGEISLYEVKPLDKVNEKENIIKYGAARLYCEENNWGFSVVSEDKIRQGYLLYNLDFLRNYPEIRTKVSNIKYLDTILEEFGPCTISELKSISTQALDESEFYMNLYYMLYKQIIKVDLINHKLNNQSLVWKGGSYLKLCTTFNMEQNF